ncbi:MAG: hypothetical protein J1F67_11220, partial [Muribaculaceae bacterium]|nr:hypothetical protein [Muribaculaceae bacterium]
MKKKNSICEFASHRSECLLKNFRESLARQSQISKIKAFQDAAEAPAPRFWVSEARATRIISLMMKNERTGSEILEGMHSEKRKMYEEIYRRTVAMKEEHPEMALGDIVFEV